jgi:hypothetical protein
LQRTQLLQRIKAFQLLAACRNTGGGRQNAEHRVEFPLVRYWVDATFANP